MVITDENVKIKDLTPRLKDLREKGFYISEELLEDISKFKKAT
jgi:predicted nucleic acid-binding protein